jgi:hypothetical protein
MYDLTLIMPISTKSIYKKRIEDFINIYGLYNCFKNKIKIFLLKGTENIKNLNIKNEKIDIEFIDCDNDNLVIKTYDFFYNLKEINSKWYVKLDDDSFNDIDGTIDILNENNYEEKKYIVGGPLIRSEIHFSERNIIDKLQINKNIYFNINHELEACWFSKKSLELILSDKTCMSYIDLRRKDTQGYTDQSFGILMNLIKCPIEKENRFYTNLIPSYNPFNLTIFNKGYLAHCHPLCEDKINLYHKLICSSIKKENKLIQTKLIKTPLGNIELLDNNKTNKQQTYWFVMDNKIIVFSKTKILFEVDISEEEIINLELIRKEKILL